MGAREQAGGRQVFRPRKILTVAMAVAGLLWVAVLVALLRFEDVPLRLHLSALFFVLFFAGSVAYYGRTLIEVDALGMTYRGVVRTLRLRFDEIRKVDVLPGPLTVYAVRGRGRFVHFTSCFAHHRALAALLIERAGLTPQRAA